MPTTMPRYQVTDTGETREHIDVAARAWPELNGNRKALLLRLAEEGAKRLEEEQRAALYAAALEHVGEWVAVADNRLLFADPDGAVVARWLTENGIRGTISRVTEPGQEEFGAHGRF